MTSSVNLSVANSKTSRHCEHSDTRQYEYTVSPRSLSCQKQRWAGGERERNRDSDSEKFNLSLTQPLDLTFISWEIQGIEEQVK